MRYFFFSLLAIAFVGCDSAQTDDRPFKVGPGQILETSMGEERAARVDINGLTVSDDNGLADSVVTGPVTVQAGVPFDVTVYTFTAPSCIRAAPSEVTLEEQEAVIAVRDTSYLVPCHFVRTYTPRTDEVVFGTPGEAVIVIKGRRESDGTSMDRPYELRFDVIVE